MRSLAGYIWHSERPWEVQLRALHGSPGVFIMGVARLALLHIRILYVGLPKRFLKH